MSAFQHPAIVGRNASRTIMRWTIATEERLGQFDRMGLGFKALLSGEQLSQVGTPNLGDAHPTPGAAKVPELVKGAILKGRA